MRRMATHITVLLPEPKIRSCVTAITKKLELHTDASIAIYFAAATCACHGVFASGPLR
jgi:hypothetical protein